MFRGRSSFCRNKGIVVLLFNIKFQNIKSDFIGLSSIKSMRQTSTELIMKKHRKAFTWTYCMWYSIVNSAMQCVMCNVAGALLPKEESPFSGQCCQLPHRHPALVTAAVMWLPLLIKLSILSRSHNQILWGRVIALWIVDCGLSGYYYNKVDVISFLYFVCRENCRSLDSSRAVY